MPFAQIRLTRISFIPLAKDPPANKSAPEPKRLYINEEEAEKVKKIYELYLAKRSLRGTTNLLNTQGYRTRRDMQWSASSVKKTLSNPTYTGRV